MSVQKMMINAVDPDWKWLYRVSGISALALGIGYIVIIPLFVLAGARPSGAEAWLTYLAGNTTVWWAILAFSVLTDFLFVPVALSLYLALKGINRNAMLLATAFVGLFVVLDLALTWTNYAALIDLSADYAVATNDVQRAAFVVAANYPSAVLESSLIFVHNTLTLSVGILMTGLVMLVVLLLYKLLKPVNKNIALLIVIFLLVAVPIAMLNELNKLAALVLPSSADYLTVFTADRLQALVLLFLDLHEQGINIAGIFWGLWLFPMGYLIYKSGFLPRILGILLMIGCFGYLIDSFAAFLFPNFGVQIAGFTFWGELLLPLWLLIKGVNVEQWKKRALESA